MAVILADTNVLIYLLEGDKTIAEFFDDNIICISFITELELLTARKYTSPQLQKINALIEKVSIYDYNQVIKHSCIKFRQKYSLKLPDAIIAATAFSYNLPLFTADIHYSKIAEIKISLYTF